VYCHNALSNWAAFAVYPLFFIGFITYQSSAWVRDFITKAVEGQHSFELFNHPFVACAILILLIIKWGAIDLKLNDYFPKKYSDKSLKPQGEGSYTVQVKFPKPTKEVELLIAKMKSYKIPLSIAADEDSITVIKSSYKNTARISNDDPILYVVHPETNLVVILAQYGNFPAEEALLQHVQSLTIEDILNEGTRKYDLA
jgi:hypothetical protein